MQRTDVVSVLRDFVNYRKIHRQPSHKAESTPYQVNCTSKLTRSSVEVSITSPSYNQGKSFCRRWHLNWGLGRLVGFQEEEIISGGLMAKGSEWAKVRGQKRMSSPQVCFSAYFSVSAVGILIPIWTPGWGICESPMIFNFLSLSKSKESLSPTDFTAPTGKNLTLFLHYHWTGLREMVITLLLRSV